MLRRTAFATLISVALATASFAANADILFTSLGTAAPPANVGGKAMTAFNKDAQAAIPDYTNVNVIPGNPLPGNLVLSASASKRTAPNGGWTSSWAHGYTGPVFFFNGATQATLTLPTNTHAFYLYLQSNAFGAHNFTVTTNSGTTSGPISASTFIPGGGDGAQGFGFYSTAGETITSITISTGADSLGFSIAEFGIDGESTTCASEGYKGAQLTWCKNICENGLTGQVLDTWIHRWINRYRDLPYCAVEGGDEGGEGDGE